MLKLNNKGWGLSVMLASLGLLLGALLLVVIMSNKFTYLLNNTDSSTNYHGNSSSHFENNSTINETVKENNYNYVYFSYEDEIRQVALNYKLNNYPQINEGDKFYININALDISDEIKISCTGYVFISDEAIKPFISCDNYQTNGYLKELDN